MVSHTKQPKRQQFPCRGNDCSEGVIYDPGEAVDFGFNLFSKAIDVWEIMRKEGITKDTVYLTCAYGHCFPYEVSLED